MLNKMKKIPDKIRDYGVSSPMKIVGIRPKLRYKKITRGSIELFGRLIKPGQIIWAYPEEISEAYSKDFTILDSKDIQELAKSENKDIFIDERVYEIAEKETHGWYDVVNSSTKKPINEKSLRKVDAELLRDSLNA